MTIEEAKNIKLEDYLHSLGYNPVKRQGMNLWYKSPFREETDASFKVNTEINKWYDFGLGKGGNILTLASVLYCSESVPYLLRQIEEQAPHICPVSFSFQKQSPTEPSFQHMEVKPLESPILLSYLRERGINTELAKRECCEVHFENNGRHYYAVGFPNVRGGYEIRNKYLRLDSCPQYPGLDKQDYMVLNSVSNVSKALYPLGNYQRIHCFFDNDRAGMEAILQIRKEYGSTINIRDASHLYSGCKDLNEYLCKRNPLREKKFIQTSVPKKLKGRSL